MIKRYFIALLISLLASTAYAQTREIDSLKRIFASVPKDSNALEIALAITTLSRGNYPATDREYCQIILDLSTKINYQYGIAIGHEEIGEYHLFDQNKVEAIDHLNAAINLYLKNERWSEVAKSKLILVVTYSGMKRFESAMKLVNEAIALSEEIGDSVRLRQCYAMKGVVLFDQGKYELALNMYRKGLNYNVVLSNPENRYRLTDIGQAHAELGNLDSAIFYLGIAERCWKERNALNGLIETYKYYGAAYQKVENFREATVYYLKALYLANRNNSFGEDHQYLYVRLTDVYEQLMKLDSALYFHKLYAAGKDSLNQGGKVAHIERKYADLREKAIREQEEAKLASELSRRNQLQYTGIFIILLVLFGAVLLAGFVRVSTKMAEGIIFFSFLILFEFLLVLADPYIEGWSRGAPGIKLLFNAGIAALIFPAHAFFESKLKGRMVKSSSS